MTNILDPCAKVSRLEIQQREKLARPDKVLLVFLLVKIKTKLGITVILNLLIADMLTGRTGERVVVERKSRAESSGERAQ